MIVHFSHYDRQIFDYHRYCIFFTPLTWCSFAKKVAMKIAQKKEMAKLLFTRESLEQKEIAERVGVSEKTVSKWVNANEGEWRRMRQSIIVTKDEQLRRIYEQIEELNTVIAQREQGKRYANSKDADTLAKLTASAKNLESEASVSEVFSVMKKFLNWLRQFDFEKARELSYTIDAFIKDMLKK